MDMFHQAKFLSFNNSDLVVLQDLDLLDQITWGLILIDECQRPTMLTHFQKIKILVAHMKLLMITSETVVCFLNHFFVTYNWVNLGHLTRPNYPFCLFPYFLQKLS